MNTVTERQNEVFSKSDAMLAEKLEQSSLALEDYFFKNLDEILSGFYSHINALCQKAKEQQTDGKKAPIAYLNICHLRSSLLTGSHEFRIALHDERLYLDTTETVAYWKPDFLFRHIDGDLDGIANKMAIFPKLTKFEVEEIKYVYTSLHFIHALHFTTALCDDIVAQTDLAALELTDDFKVIFSGHMENGITIYPVQITEEDSEIPANSETLDDKGVLP